VLAKVKKEIMSEQQAAEMKKRAVHRMAAKVKAKTKATATKPQRWKTL
jgi:hypothetical protein